MRECEALFEKVSEADAVALGRERVRLCVALPVGSENEKECVNDFVVESVAVGSDCEIEPDKVPVGSDNESDTDAVAVGRDIEWLGLLVIVSVTVFVSAPPTTTDTSQNSGSTPTRRMRMIGGMLVWFALSFGYVITPRRSLVGLHMTVLCVYLVFLCCISVVSLLDKC